MVRVDVWDIPRADADDVILLGLPQTFHDTYILGNELGRGGFGVVSIATDRFTGQQLACKVIEKRLSVPNLAAAKQAQHLDKITREIEVLRRLRGSLNVAQLRGAYEDAGCVYITMEWCKGGELWHRIGKAHYSEKTVSSYMRAVLRTAAQCHNNRILHRDIKPGNFMLLSDSPKAPLKAIDFGLAVFYNENELPRTDLGLEGTPWFMAPEVLECSVGPPADVWAAGVMAYQLLSGNLPFDDRSNPRAPAVSKIWQAIFGQQPKMTGSAWANISEDAKDFVKALLDKDPKKRPTARQALNHAWLKGSAADRTHGKALDKTVVQRIQHFSQGNVLRKTIFELIAGELLKAADVQPGSSLMRKCQSSSGQSMHHFRNALSLQITPEQSQYGTLSEEEPLGTPPKTETAAAATAATAATAAAAAATAAATAAAATAAQDDGCGGEAEESAHDVTSEKGEKTDVGFVPNDGSGSGSRGGKVTGGGNSTVGDFSRPSSEMSFVHPAPDGSCREGPGQFQIRARSMSMGALDNLVDSSLHSADGSVGRMTDVNNRIFEAAKERANLGVTAGGSAHAGLQFYGAIEDYDGAHTSVVRSLPRPRPARIGSKRPNTVHGGRSYFGGPALGPLAGNSRYRLMRAAAAAGRLPGRDCDNSDYVHVAPRTASERYEQRKAARLSLDTSFPVTTSHKSGSPRCAMSSIMSSDEEGFMDDDEMSIMPSEAASGSQLHQLSLELERQQQQSVARGLCRQSSVSSTGDKQHGMAQQQARNQQEPWKGGSTAADQRLRLPLERAQHTQPNDVLGTQGGRSLGLYKAFVENSAPSTTSLPPLVIGRPAGGETDFASSMDLNHDEVEAFLDCQAQTSISNTPTTASHPGTSQPRLFSGIITARLEAVQQSEASSNQNLHRPGSAPAATSVLAYEAQHAMPSDPPGVPYGSAYEDVASAAASAGQALSPSAHHSSPIRVQALADDGSMRRISSYGGQSDGLMRLQSVPMEGRPPRRSPINDHSSPSHVPLVSQPSTPVAPPYANAGPFIGGEGSNSGRHSREGSGSGRYGIRNYLGLRRPGSLARREPPRSPEVEERCRQEGESWTIEMLGRRSMEAPPSQPEGPSPAPGWPDMSGTLPGEREGTGAAARKLSLSRQGSQEHLEGSRHGGSRRGSGSGSFALAAATAALSECESAQTQSDEEKPPGSMCTEPRPRDRSSAGSQSTDRRVRFGGATAVSDDNSKPNDSAAAGTMVASNAATHSRAVHGRGSSPDLFVSRSGQIAVPKEVHDLMHSLHFSPEEEGMAAGRLAEGLQRLGYALEEGEAERLLETAAGTSTVPKAKFLASQIDWGAYQMNFREQWLLAAKRAFDTIEGAASSLLGGSGNPSRGALNSKALIDLLRQRLPWAEVDYAVEDALLEAGAVDADEIDFEGFLRLLRVESEAQLDQYESRHHGNGSHHGSSHQAGSLSGAPSLQD